jgi:hypothetical protein
MKKTEISIGDYRDIKILLPDNTELNYTYDIINDILVDQNNKIVNGYMKETITNVYKKYKRDENINNLLDGK